MAAFLDEAYYLKSKLAQLQAEDPVTYGAWNTNQVKQAIEDAGMTVQQHYEQYSMTEGTSPNAYFNTIEYLEAKAAQLNSHAEGGKTNWDAASVAKAFQDAGLTPEQHYLQYGCKETDANGYLINPSNAFDANAYVQAKLAQLVASGDPQYTEWTAADVVNAIAEAGMTPVDHYEDYGKQEGAASGISMVQTVPVTQRVSNDDLRAATGENVPSNYNKPVDAPSEVTAATATAVDKPCDMATSTKPAEPVAVPGDSDYIAVPGGGITDTNANPVVLVTATVTDDTGKVLNSETQYGVASTSTENGVTTKTVQPVNSDGTVNATAAPIQTVETNSSTGTITTTTNLTDSEGNTLSVTENVTPTANGGTQTTTSATLTDENNKQIAKTETTTTANAAGEQTGSTSTYTDANNQTHTTESGDVPSPTPTPTPTPDSSTPTTSSFTLSALTDAAVGEDGKAALNGTASADTITLDSLPSGEKWTAATALTVDAKAGNDTIAVANSLVASEDAYWQALAVHYNVIAQNGGAYWTKDKAKVASTDAGLTPPQGGLTAVNVDGGAGTDTLNITGDLDLSKWTLANVENVNFGTHFVSMSAAEFNKIATAGHTLTGHETGELSLVGDDTTTNVVINKATLKGGAVDNSDSNRWDTLSMDNKITSVSLTADDDVNIMGLKGDALTAVNLEMTKVGVPGQEYSELTVKSIDGASSGAAVNVKGTGTITLGALTDVKTINGDDAANRVEINGDAGYDAVTIDLGAGTDTFVVGKKMTGTVAYKMAAASTSADTLTLLPGEYDDDSGTFDAATACTGNVLPHVKLDVSAFLGSNISSTASTNGFSANALTVVSSSDKAGTSIDAVVANLFNNGGALHNASLANGRAILAVKCAAGEGGTHGEDNPASVYIFGVTGDENFAANAASHVQLLGTVEWTTEIGVDNFVTA
ncbi:MAG: hypothetical protein IJU65_06050 [Desulfovibrio sp.]|nr:hypothetical protein [Desulfovibrio sp.]